MKDGVELLLRDSNAVFITAVNDVDDSLCVGVVTSPVRSDACLAPQVPDLELDVFVRHRLDIETDGCSETRLLVHPAAGTEQQRQRTRDRGHHLAHL
jgi:hypothetical protein